MPRIMFISDKLVGRYTLMNNEYLEIESDSDKKMKSNEEDIRDNKIIVRLMILFVVNKIFLNTLIG